MREISDSRITGGISEDTINVQERATVRKYSEFQFKVWAQRQSYRIHLGIGNTAHRPEVQMLG